MSQHDFIIANQGFPATRSDINDALQSLASTSSGASAPSTTYANQLWYDSANNILKIRNEDNDAWISLVTLNQTTDAVTNFENTPSLTGNNTLSGTNTFSGAMSATANAYMAIDALTDASTIAVDMSVGNNFSVTLGGNRTLGNPTNLTAGQSGVIFITQDGTGSRTLAYSSYWDFPSQTAPTLTTTANAVDVLVYTVRSSTSIAAQLLTNIG
jgi:hypothetical protein